MSSANRRRTFRRATSPLAAPVQQPSSEKYCVLCDAPVRANVLWGKEKHFQCQCGQNNAHVPCVEAKSAIHALTLECDGCNKRYSITSGYDFFTCLGFIYAVTFGTPFNPLVFIGNTWNQRNERRALYTATQFAARLILYATFIFIVALFGALLNAGSAVNQTKTHLPLHDVPGVVVDSAAYMVSGEITQYANLTANATKQRQKYIDVTPREYAYLKKAHNTTRVYYASVNFAAGFVPAYGITVFFIVAYNLLKQCFSYVLFRRSPAGRLYIDVADK
jgi:hypothetical protein